MWAGRSCVGTNGAPEIDGCHTACSGLLEDSFGADSKEMNSDTPLEIDWYENTNGDPNRNQNQRLRPGACLAFNTDTIIRDKMNEYVADAVTSLGGWRRAYETYRAGQ